MEWIHAVTRPLLRLFEISIESFFFVPEGIPGGWLLAVPNRFKTIRQDSSNNSRLSDHIYAEEVYDLESLRYPVKIRLMEDLPERMIEQLRKSIAGKVINSQLYISWKLWKIDTGVETLRSKYSAARIVNATWRFLLPAFEMIHPNDYFVSDPDASSKDKRVSADIHVRLCSSDEIVILGEGLDPVNAETYISDLVKLASGEIRSNFEGELPDKFVGHEAILAKLSYEIMDNWGKGPRWAIVFGGNIYIIYLVLPVVVDNRRRCSFISSGALYIDDRKSPYFALMLYMMISSHMTHGQLAATLRIEVLSESKLALANETSEVETESFFTKPVQASTLSIVPAVYLATSFDPSTPLLFHRLEDVSQDNDQTQCRDGAFPTYLLEHSITGTSSIVYRSKGIIVKVSLPNCHGDMENEVKIYQHLMKTRASKYIPRLYGHFGYRTTRAIIISDEGPAPLYHPDDLSNELKTEFFNAIIEIHKANVVLDDLELYNVLIGERGLFISEFSRASMDHKCPGISECPELLGVQEFFDIDGSEWFTKDSPRIYGDQIASSGDYVLGTRSTPTVDIVKGITLVSREPENVQL